MWKKRTWETKGIIPHLLDFFGEHGRLSNMIGSGTLIYLNVATWCIHVMHVDFSGVISIAEGIRINPTQPTGVYCLSIIQLVASRVSLFMFTQILGTLKS